ncbi:hypothetical protein C7399_12075 [Paraburkholderia tropica]|uniref:GAPS4 PD-(D/E)XK nuclease domain-containing protein n=1 Tax=Paraburkholderia tropica TaxID=92647 RepID=A0ABX5MHJ6_9BURK|nr:hypothetical protein [Paraburkholderia tropica]PXX10806.1 hypothetical protein C7400_12075 [Paraburkholderia tropica]PZW75774.1 hypothetical protein C7399_12075 [Paraburkholderia tropica]
MAETANIAAMAERLSNELFAEFFWSITGPMNSNWACEKKEQHKVTTHPSDVVFYYDDPYSRSRVYVNCDLKSYAKSSITFSALKGALESLSKQVSCAEVSDEWRQLYIHPNVTPSICGLLFVYNHDGEYDKEFKTHLRSLKSAQLDLPKGSRLIVLGPEDIFWLDNVRYEIVQMRGRRTGGAPLPDPEHCRYFYPQLVRRKNLELGHARAATLEMLTSQLIVLEYDRHEQNEEKGLILFYRGEGSRPEEFTYLFDYLRSLQLLKEGIDIEIKLLNASDVAQPMFQKAQQVYVDGLSDASRGSPLAERVKQIRFKRMSQVLTRFSDIELGMDYA